MYYKRDSFYEFGYLILFHSSFCNIDKNQPIACFQIHIYVPTHVIIKHL